MITLVNKYKDDFAGYNLMDPGVKKIGPGSNLNTPIRKELWIKGLETGNFRQITLIIQSSREGPQRILLQTKNIL